MPKSIQQIAKKISETEEITLMFLEKILHIAEKQKGATVIALHGDLGAGKTTCTQFIGKYFGIKHKITSPTFVILKKYPIKKIQKSKKYTHLIHIDAYRLEGEKDLLSLKWDDILQNEQHLIFVEWPENIQKALPRNTSHIYISHMKDGYRNLKLT